MGVPSQVADVMTRFALVCAVGLQLRWLGQSIIELEPELLESVRSRCFPEGERLAVSR